MREEIDAYFKFLSNFHKVDRPKVPKFDVEAFKDRNYLETFDDFTDLRDFLESVELDIDYLEGKGGDN